MFIEEAEVFEPKSINYMFLPGIDIEKPVNKRALTNSENCQIIEH
jgi:hypothetical protein